ncbi:MAG: hypothetical protein R2713_24275 [Ilumatobacteraceae bacterium]
MEITTVADDLIVAHDGVVVRRLEHLEPDTVYDVGGVEARTLARPAGELRCRIATVNDVHFGELEAGRIDHLAEGPVQRGPRRAAVPRDDEPGCRRRDRR